MSAQQALARLREADRAALKETERLRTLCQKKTSEATQLKSRCQSLQTALTAEVAHCMVQLRKSHVRPTSVDTFATCT